MARPRLSPSKRAQLKQHITETADEHLSPTRSTKTKEHIDNIARRFCEETDVNSRSKLCTQDVPAFRAFLVYLLECSHARPRRAPITKEWSLKQYWKQFGMFFERETSKKLDEPVRDQIKRYIERKLRPKFQLSLKPKEKPTLQWEDLHLILYFHI
ncbi:hypothetical protein LTR49_028923 [Elasticomyces elasticus]|nr:hypothetical protein LTR49_028923 [Elasticomyces elasticus]